MQFFFKKSLVFVFALLISTAVFSQQPSNDQKWITEELTGKRQILEAFWQKRIIEYNPKSAADFKSAILNIHFPKDSVWENKIEQLFTDAKNQKINFNLFYEALKDQPFLLIEIMNNIEQLISQKQYEDTVPHINKNNLLALQQYMIDKKFSAAITLGSKYAKLITPDFPENLAQYTFAMHSVGKVFTGILALIMIEENIFTEKDLLQPVQLDDHVLKQLPLSIREQLKKVSLHQLMTHKAGIGDYLGQYSLAISQGHIPEIKRAEDFLPFVEDQTFPAGEFRYSNAGLLLVGLAIQHAYEKKYNQSMKYNDILKHYIIDKVGMNSFSPWKPQNGKFNLKDPIAPHLVGSPAGGYWISSADLARFGQWIYGKAKSDPAFKLLLQKYGQEFYLADRQLVVHGGGIPSSMAFFSVSLETGAIQALLSDQPPPQASDLKEMIMRHMFQKEIIKGDKNV